ncbi:hypothetical protein CcI6DRAFT_04047 [Frankia sp. CcI6]|nr:hypothetical protein CcI6DRAFT_04047 [Frankia sp. CcI6]KEZ34830.1 hypothetical protein CEDDRAFT_03820 [Frankia sp. CeD]KFB03240.1 hypothetical protein ALLO2DRAFT_04008 [Frankia sp. Allo2]
MNITWTRETVPYCTENTSSPHRVVLVTSTTRHQHPYPHPHRVGPGPGPGRRLRPQAPAPAVIRVSRTDNARGRPSGMSVNAKIKGFIMRSDVRNGQSGRA